MLKDSSINKDKHVSLRELKPWNVQHTADNDLSNVIVRPCERNVVDEI